jgi:AraC-like DNA-binding protein
VKTQNIPYNQWFKGFLSQKSNPWLIFTSLFLLGVSYFSFFARHDLIIYPGNDKILVNFYNDSFDGGNSKIESGLVSNGSIHMAFTLKQGFVRPYVGITVLNKDISPINISGYNQMQFEMEGKELKNMVVYLVNNLKDPVIKGKTMKLHFSRNIELVQHAKKFVLNLDQFKVPDWWYDVNNLSPEQDFKLDLKNISNISFTTGLTPELGTKRFLKINSIRFTRNNNWIILGMTGIESLIILCLLFLHFLKTRKSDINNPVVITYKPVEIEKKSKTRASFLDYIHENFQDSELSLSLIEQKTGISQRLISESISEKFNCNVKTYINQIRINEARRLLKDTDLNISEIAYKVGFSSPSNFNRVFKKLIGISPTEFLQKEQ